MTRRKTLDLPKHNNPTSADRTACAPYNFVPLPDKVVLAVNDANDLPDHDTYAHETYKHTGYFDVTLTTKSPLFVRCALERDKFDLDEQGKDSDGRVLDEHRKDSDGNRAAKQTLYAKRIKNTPDFFYTRDPEQPVIPGSSLRGMLRSLLEVLSYGKVKNVDNKPKVFYRAVAAGNQDALGKIYKAKIRNVAAGYLVKQNNEWFVHPAKRPDVDAELSGMTFLRVKESEITAGSVSGFLPFNNDNYLPQYHEVSFNATVRYNDDNQAYVSVTNIGARASGYQYNGVLVCTGNMLETAQDAGDSLRTRHALVLEADTSSTLIKINTQAVIDHIEALTQFQQSPPFNEQLGCLEDGRPIFYVKDGNEIKLFGHTPNFRLPANSNLRNGAQTPLDFVPKQLNKPEDVDYSEALFGLVRSAQEIAALKKLNASLTKQGSKNRAYASRVFVTDAALTDAPDGLWLRDAPITPKILATPKPTCFQHYLVQKEPDRIRVGTRNDGTPKFEIRLRHYSSPSPEETVIRGHKLYWHQGDREASDIAQTPQPESTSKQHTQMKPVRSGVSFKFRVYFENLSDEELGAMCWTLHPLGDANKTYIHKLGMGKPFGMGAVELKATLHLSNRQTRYESLFDGDAWRTGYAADGEELNQTNVEKWAKKFEEKVINEFTFKPGQTCARLSDLKRIAVLLKMMEWSGYPARMTGMGDRAGNTRYMTITPNEYKERPVLPDPSATAFGGLTGDAEPEPDRPSENPPAVTEDARKGDAPTRTAVKTVAPRVSQAHAEKKSRAEHRAIEAVSLDDIGRRQAENKQAAKVVKQSDGEYDETATVVEIIAGDKVVLETKSKKRVTGKLQNSFLQIEAGDRCRAKIRYLKGEAVSAKVISRL